MKSKHVILIIFVCMCVKHSEDKEHTMHPPPLIALINWLTTLALIFRFIQRNCKNNLPGPRFTKNLKSDRNLKPISGAKMRFSKIMIL